MNIYFPEYYGSIKQSEVFDFARPYIDKWNKSITNRSIQYEKLQDGNADAVVFPLSLEFYLENRISKKKLYEHLKILECSTKPIFIFNSGDRGIQIPKRLKRDNVFFLRQSGYKSRLPKNHFAIPVIRQDPFLLTDLEFCLVDDTSWITIGFCGQSADVIFEKILKQLRLIIHSILSLLKVSKYSREHVWPVPTVLRANILKRIESDSRFKSDFIRRQRYKAGAKRGSSLEARIWKEFYSNMNDNLYTLCIRGSGNFSARFYETLAMGRIPIILDTDQLWPVPLQDMIHRNCVHVPYASRQNIGEFIYHFHSEKKAEEISEIQRQNRLFWERYCTRKGFGDNFDIYIRKAQEQLSSIS